MPVSEFFRPGPAPPMTFGAAKRAVDFAHLTGMPNLLVVDAAWRVVLVSATDIWEAAGIRVRVGRAIPVALQTLVTAAIESLQIDRATAFCASIMPWPGIAVTFYAVASVGEPLIALTAQQFRARKNLRYAQRAYGLSPREIEILHHVLGGLGTSQIANALSIADSTVIAHVKSLLIKTRAANRAALVARVLGWEETLPIEGG